MQITETNNMWSLFKDKNEINEKNVVGFISFIVMVLFAIADLVTSFIFIDAGKLNFNVKDSYVDLLQLVLITVIGAYFGGRSLEKVKK